MTDSADPRSPAPLAATGNSTSTALANTAPAQTARDAHGYDPADYDWVPVLRKPRADGWTPQKQRAFIGELADCGSVEQAAREVHMTRAGAYALRRAPGGEAFAAAWDAAIHQAAHGLIDVAFDRAFNGSDEPVWDRNGLVIGRKHRQSDALIMFLLRKHFPERYGDLHRDRPERTAAPPAPTVAASLIALDPVRPADPLAAADPDDANMLLQIAEIMDGKLPSFQRQDGSVEHERELAAAAYVNPRFEALLAAAKQDVNSGGIGVTGFAEDRTRVSRRRKRR